VLEWAQTENGIEEIRKRTAKHFHQGNIFLYLLCFNINWFTLIDIIESCIILKVLFLNFFSESSMKRFKKSILDPESVGLELNTAQEI